MLFCYLNPFKGKLAWNMLKTLTLTTFLKNIYWVWNILDFNSVYNPVVYFCTFFKTPETASPATIKKAYMWRFASYFW